MAAIRLERALERIAALANRGPIVRSDGPAGPGAAPVVNADEIAHRLDALIAQIRSALSA